MKLCDDCESQPPVVGRAESACDDDGPDYPVAIIYLPDPSERRGVLTRWVSRQKPQEEGRKAGFKL